MSAARIVGELSVEELRSVAVFFSAFDEAAFKLAVVTAAELGGRAPVHAGGAW